MQYSLQLKYFNNASKIGIIRVAREHINLVWTSIIFLTKFEKKEYRLKIRILDCKATIKKIENSLKVKLKIWLNNFNKNFMIDDEKKINVEKAQKNDEESKLNLKKCIEEIYEKSFDQDP